MPLSIKDLNTEELKMTEKLGILIVGHGSRLPYNKEVVLKIADIIAKKHPEKVINVGFVEHCGPSIKEAAEAFSGTGVTKIAAVPVFIASGVHITEDIPGEIGLDETGNGILKIDGKDVTVVYAKPLGADELIADLIFKRVLEAYEQ